MKQSGLILLGIVLITFALINNFGSIEFGWRAADSGVNQNNEFLIEKPIEKKHLLSQTNFFSGIVATITPTPEITPEMIEMGPSILDGVEQTEEMYEPILPLQVIIESIELKAPIKAAIESTVSRSGYNFFQWEAPDEFAAGWHLDSAHLGEPGNIVLNGHNNINGMVFRYLHQIQVGDKVSVTGSDQKSYTYLVTNVMILAERDVSIDQRLDNARWISASEDTRLTLITCWPVNSNTHRLIVVAKPLYTTETDTTQSY
jgi:LPXTG-site transpeptidase (sortase) family protein